MVAGTAINLRYIIVHDVRTSLPDCIIKNLPVYHAITGFYITSQLSEHDKKSTWVTCYKQPDMKEPCIMQKNLCTDMLHCVGHLDNLS